MDRQKVEAEIQKIVRQLVKKYQPQKIILFGSAAWGKMTPGSDLDLVVVKEGLDKISLHQRAYEISGLFDSDWPVDLLVYTPYEIKKELYLGDPFVRQIVERGRVLYGA
jgi:predicted nucleotidyltransferase